MAKSRARKTGSRARKMGSRSRKMGSRAMKMVSRTARKMGSRARKMGSRARKMMGGDDDYDDYDDDDEHEYAVVLLVKFQNQNRADGLGGPPTSNNDKNRISPINGKEYEPAEFRLDDVRGFWWKQKK